MVYLMTLKTNGHVLSRFQSVMCDVMLSLITI